MSMPCLSIQLSDELNEKLCKKKQSYGVICKKQNAKHNMEKLCEKKKQYHLSMMPLLSAA